MKIHIWKTGELKKLNRQSTWANDVQGITVLLYGRTKDLSIFKRLLTRFGVIQPLIQWATEDISAGVRWTVREPDH